MKIYKKVSVVEYKRERRFVVGDERLYKTVASKGVVFKAHFTIIRDTEMIKGMQILEQAEKYYEFRGAQNKPLLNRGTTTVISAAALQIDAPGLLYIRGTSPGADLVIKTDRRHPRYVGLELEGTIKLLASVYSEAWAYTDIGAASDEYRSEVLDSLTDLWHQDDLVSGTFTIEACV